MADASTTAPLLRVRDLETSFPLRSPLLRRKTGEVKAVAGVSFDVHRGTTVGLVGESGSGKSTLARTVVGLTKATAGSVEFEGQEITGLSSARMRPIRRDIQIVFQDPYASLNPRLTVGQIVAEAWSIHRDVVPRSRWAIEARSLLEKVGLDPDHADRYPHQFSGGQRQRIGIARALVLRPRFLVADEPVSALDVSVQSQVLNLLVELKNEMRLTYLFIAHNLAVVGYISDRVAVMYLGTVVEQAPSALLYERPLHPYTMALLSAVPQAHASGRRKPIVLQGDVPSPVDPPSGCRFRTRCPIAQQVCADVEPPLVEHAPGHLAACHFPGESMPNAAVRAIG